MDRIDRDLLALIQRDGRMPYARLGEHVGLICGPAGARIKNFLAMLEEYMASASGGTESKTTYDANGIATSFFGSDDDDEVDGYDNLMAAGGAGNDRIDGYRNLYAIGGDGDDYISGYDNTQAAGNDGNDRIEGYDNLRASGGRGNDHISGYDNLRVDGGEGDDDILVNSNAAILYDAGDTGKYHQTGGGADPTAEVTAAAGATALGVTYPQKCVLKLLDSGRNRPL